MMLGRQWRVLAVMAACCAPVLGCAEGSASDDDDAAGLFDDDTGKAPTDDTGEKGTDTGEGEDAVVDTDSGVDPDAGTVDTDSGMSTMDSGVIDTGVIDTGPRDNGIIDTGPIDTGVVDTGPRDTGVDLGPPDTGPVDTGPVDTGSVGVRCSALGGLVTTMCAGRYACCVSVDIPTDGGSIPFASLCGCQVRAGPIVLFCAPGGVASCD